MAKRRKKTNSKIPAKGRLRDMADEMWSLAVKDDWAHKCAMCGRRSSLNSHHLLPRGHTTTRYDLRNGICLCATCHAFDNARGPHLNAAGFMVWLWKHFPARATWYEGSVLAGDYKNFAGTTNATFYCDTILRLKEYATESDYRRICGVKFSEWLDSRA
jgi:HNH endonuclease